MGTRWTGTARAVAVAMAITLWACGGLTREVTQEPFGQEVGLSCDPSTWDFLEEAVYDFGEDADGFASAKAAADDWWTHDGTFRDDRDRLQERITGTAASYADADGEVVVVLRMDGPPGRVNVTGVAACVQG